MKLVVSGLLTNYEDIGSGKNTVFILPGWKRTSAEWFPTAKKLSEKFHVIILDLPGFGFTQHGESINTVFDYADFVSEFLKKVDLKKVILLGHSFGGRLGIILAAKEDLIDKLILVDAAGRESKSLKVKIFNFLASVSSPILPKPLKRVLALFIGSDDYNSSGEMKKIFVNVVNEDLTPLFSKIEIPTYLIWGERDKILPVSKAEIMKKEIKGSGLRIVWEAGHDPHIEDPEQFMSILYDIL